MGYEDGVLDMRIVAEIQPTLQNAKGNQTRQ